MRFAVVFEKTDTGYSAHVPDLPGCIAAGADLDETQQLIREAIEMHLEGIKEDGNARPQPTTITDYVTVTRDMAG
jgi:predicted RNase H-like HicB family nuclease